MLDGEKYEKNVTGNGDKTGVGAPSDRAGGTVNVKFWL